MREDVQDEDELRSRIIEQLEQSLAMSQGRMTNLKLDPKAREKWTQLRRDCYPMVARMYLQSGVQIPPRQLGSSSSYHR